MTIRQTSLEAAASIAWPFGFNSEARKENLQMGHSLADHDIRKLPVMVLRAIRHGTYQVSSDESIEEVQHLSRVVMRAAAAGHDVMPVLVDYAAKVDNAMPRLVEWTSDMQTIHDMTWPFVASPYALASTFWIENGKPNTIADLTKAIQAWVAKIEAEEAVSPADADRDIRAEMERVRNLYPKIGMSYGYIGNLWSGPFRDDRSFRIFTQVQHNDARFGETIRFGDHSYDRLSRLRTMVLANLEGWAKDLNDRLDAGELRLRSTAHLKTIAADPAPLGRAA